VREAEERDVPAGCRYLVHHDLHTVPDGTYTTDFDYDGEPEEASCLPEHYAREVARFFRDPEHVPEWLKAALDRVPNLYAAVYAEPGERYEDEIGPHLGETARAFKDEGWSLGPGEFDGEWEFSTDWARLETMSRYGLIRVAGTLEPGRWDDLVAFFTRQDWNFGASLYEGEEIVATVDPRTHPRDRGRPVPASEGST
jgi:hypothetical protein